MSVLLKFSAGMGVEFIGFDGICKYGMFVVCRKLYPPTGVSKNLLNNGSVRAESTV